MAWNERFKILLTTAIEKSGSADSIDFDALVDEAFKGESEANREALAKQQIRNDFGIKLRKWALAVEQPMIPDLLDGFVERNGEYVHASQLSREEWQIRKFKLQRRIASLVARVAAIDEVLEQDDLPEEGTA